jgi:hypothetical protein
MAMTDVAFSAPPGIDRSAPTPPAQQVVDVGG